MTSQDKIAFGLLLMVVLFSGIAFGRITTSRLTPIDRDDVCVLHQPDKEHLEIFCTIKPGHIQP